MINNIYWVGNLHVLGGVETAMYELAKQFTDYDFVIYYNNIPTEQLKRLKRYVKCVKYNGEKLKCKKLFMNYDISIIDNVEAEEYVEIVHCVFEKNVAKPHTHDKITKYYAVGIEACESFKRLTGKPCEVLHNLLQIEKPRKVLRLISATRLASDKGKIVWRMQQLVYALERANIPYEWKIFTNGQHLINGKGIIYMQPTLDIRDYIADSDYLVQLSDTEAFCYSVLESLYLHIPVIVTPIPCFDEMGVENGKNGYILDFDMKNISIEDIYNKIPRFDYQPFKNEWLDKIEKVKGNYKEELEMEVRVRALPKFEGIRDSERNVKPKAGDEWVCSKERADFLLEHGVIEIVEEVKEKIDFENVNNIITTKEALKDIEPLDVNNAIERIQESAKETVEIEKPKKKKKTSKKEVK